MISCGDTKTGAEVVNDGPYGGLPKEGSPNGLDEADSGDTEDKDDVEPVDVLVPVLLRDGLVCDVRLLRIVLWIPVGLRLCSLSRGLLRLKLGLDSKHAGSGLM